MVERLDQKKLLKWKQESSREPTLLKVWIFFGLLFLVFASVLLVDSYKNAHCNRLLAQGKLAEAKLHKIKKNRRGQYTWDLEFKTQESQLITGRRVAKTHDGKGNPTFHPTVVYSDEDLGCWDISSKPNENAIPWSERKLILLLTTSVGIFFGVVGLFLVAISTKLLRKPRSN